MRDFLDFIQADAPGYVEIRSIRDGKIRQWWEEDRQKAVDLALRSSDEGWDAYYGVLPRTDRAGDSEHISVVVPTLWSDLDAKSKDKATVLRALTEFRVPPSVVIDSGHGYHAYWRLDGTCYWEVARKAMIGLAKQLDGDHVYDKARILRIPGTVNWKDPDKPMPVRAIVFNTEAVYRLSDLFEEVYIGEAAVDHARAQPRAVGYVPPQDRNDLPDWLEALIRDGAPQGQRSEQSWKVMCQLINRGWSDAEILSAFEQGGIGEKMREKKAGERWFTKSLAKARTQAWRS